MKVRSIELSWFRGAADSAQLETNDRSVVVFGSNGAGKSCFVDAVEYTLRGGRIMHLAHQYSGRNQEKAVLNTHRPSGARTSIRIRLADRTQIDGTVSETGEFAVEREGQCAFQELDCAQTVLRQDEVSQFIHSTKGEKYSVLLPLLGLADLETAAENFRQLSKAVQKQSGVAGATAELRTAEAQFKRLHEPLEVWSAESAVSVLCQKFVTEAHRHTFEQCAALVQGTLESRLRGSSALERRQMALERLGKIDLRTAIVEARRAASMLAGVADRVLRDRLEVLQAAASFLGDNEGVETLECPACGTSVPRSEMVAHVQVELEKLHEAETRTEEYRTKIRDLSTLVDQAVSACQSGEITVWASESTDERTSSVIEAASAYELPRDEIADEDLQEVLDRLGPAVLAAAAAASFLPPPATDLANAQDQLRAASSLRAAAQRVQSSKISEALADRISEIETDIRREINDKSGAVIEEISSDVQRFWRILHPGEPIEDVRLHVPTDSEKAIDIALKFYGRELDSPRLTLSEGYRNSLGLCVFLAMAARNGKGDTPILLDDVIVSLDRGHRGMVADLLQQKFHGRQILLFTHDRDWYTDLRQQLGDAHWSFRELLPYTTPAQGIRWAATSSSLGDARGYLDTRADTAANEARKVMDIELAIYCERLEIPLPFARGARNDRRGAHEFLSGLISEGRNKFKKKTGGRREPNGAAIQAFEDADRLLVTWGNRGSHTADVTPAEAERLISACEGVLHALSCEHCGKPLYHLQNPSNQARQCECGVLRWK